MPWNSDCSSIKTVTIEVGVTGIGECAFRCCSSLTDIYYCGTQEKWDNISCGEETIPTGTVVHCCDDDCNGDGSVNILDYQALYALVKKV